MDVSFEDYVGMSGAAKAWGIERMLQHYGIDMATWTQIAGGWNQRIPADLPHYGTYGLLVEQEGARLAMGGAPRAIGAPAAGATPGAQPAQPQPGPYGQPPYGPQPPAQQPYGQPQQPYGGQQFERDAQNFGNALGSAASSGLNALGSAFGGLGKSLSINAGSRVLVTWSDGKRYPGTVAQVAQGQYLIAMGDGQQHWIQAAYVTLP